MIIDNITLISSIIVFITSIAAITIAEPFIRRLSPKRGRGRLDTAGMPPVSVVVVSNGDAEQMDNHLSAILTQVYEPGFEVIVVATQHDSQTEDVLKRYSNSKNLYTTFAPGDSLFMSKAKLAITIGVKAAHNEWILLTDSRHMPETDSWIETMAGNCQESTDVVMGYSRYADDTRHFYKFKHLLESMYSFHRACRKNAVVTKSANIMFRKSAFIQNDGFRGNLEFIQGEYDFLVNKYSSKGTVAVETSPSAWLTGDKPSANTWRGEQVSLINYRHKLSGISAYRARHITDTIILHAAFIMTVADTALGAAMSNWILTATAAVSLIILVTMRTVFAAKRIAMFQAGVPIWKVFPYEIRCMWSNIANRLTYIRTDKNEFSNHKI